MSQLTGTKIRQNLCNVCPNIDTGPRSNKPCLSAMYWSRARVGRCVLEQTVLITGVDGFRRKKFR